MDRNSYIILLVVIVGISFYLYSRDEHMTGGYGTLSGLYFNNPLKYCFTNPHDPPGTTYCTTIGKVVI